MMANNTYGGERTGAAKDGPALLAGILRCRRCGRKLMVRYTGNNHDVLRYVCYRGWLDNGEPPCVGFGGLLVDEALAKEILRVVQPAAMEAAVLATEEQREQQDQVMEALRRDLEAARYSVGRAQKQYDLADPLCNVRSYVTCGCEMLCWRVSSTVPGAHNYSDFRKAMRPAS
jgi:hypothetical protein